MIGLPRSRPGRFREGKSGLASRAPRQELRPSMDEVVTHSWLAVGGAEPPSPAGGWIVMCDRDLADAGPPRSLVVNIETCDIATLQASQAALSRESTTILEQIRWVKLQSFETCPSYSSDSSRLLGVSSLLSRRAESMIGLPAQACRAVARSARSRTECWLILRRTGVLPVPPKSYPAGTMQSPQPQKIALIDRTNLSGFQRTA